MATRKKKGPEGTVEETVVFGVYQKQTGSYTLGENRFPPLEAVEAPESVKTLACEENTPVKFFDDLEAANKDVARLQAKFNPPKA